MSEQLEMNYFDFGITRSGDDAEITINADGETYMVSFSLIELARIHQAITEILDAPKTEG